MAAPTGDRIPRWQRVYLAACAGVIGFALAYAACDFAGWPRLTYDPIDRSWWFASGRPRPIPMNYVGTALWGAGGAMCGALATWLASRRLRAPLSAGTLRLFGGWALAAFVYAGLYYTWNLWPF